MVERSSAITHFNPRPWTAPDRPPARRSYSAARSAVILSQAVWRIPARSRIERRRMMPGWLAGKYVVVAALIPVAAAGAALVGVDDAPASTATLARATPDQSPAQRRARGFTGEDVVHNFYFTRGMFRGSRRSWSTDAPQADRWIASVIDRLTLIDVAPHENYVALDDPDLRRFPFLYILEVGGMRLSEAEAEGLRNYMLHGGFVMVDDFWGTYEWANWEYEIRRVLPEYDIVEIPLDHEIFSTMYLVDEVVQVPSVNNIRRGTTYERDGYVPHVLGIFDEDERLMMVINWNTDIGDAWEWAEAPYYPLPYSTYAYQVAANIFTYAMTH
ncbi:MAG: DUF4159 domain-containing protein [Gemmatimonas sp.]|nr:DUF4159 domain-containing protein [Gemmatimonas sp.]